jgi:hypothetical protein
MQFLQRTRRNHYCYRCLQTPAVIAGPLVEPDQRVLACTAMQELEARRMTHRS